MYIYRECRFLLGATALSSTFFFFSLTLSFFIIPQPRSIFLFSLLLFPPFVSPRIFSSCVFFSFFLTRLAGSLLVSLRIFFSLRYCAANRLPIPRLFLPFLMGPTLVTPWHLFPSVLFERLEANVHHQTQFQDRAPLSFSLPSLSLRSSTLRPSPPSSLLHTKNLLDVFFLIQHSFAHHSTCCSARISE